MTESDDQRAPRPQTRRTGALGRWRDGSNRYGWISIGLHWSAAVVILALWFVGNSIGAPTDKDFDATVRVHTTIALAAYGVLLLRVFWRLHAGHPGPSPGHSRTSFRFGWTTHYVMAACLAAMLVSGPLMAWGGDIPLRLGDLPIPPLAPKSANLFEIMHVVHASAAAILMGAVCLHVAGVAKHLVFDRDGTFDRMMVPGEDIPQPEEAEEIPPAARWPIRD